MRRPRACTLSASDGIATLAGTGTSVRACQNPFRMLASLLMKAYRRRIVPRAVRSSGDYSKRRGYVIFDISVRALSALGVVALGLAGWWFQVTTSRVKERQELSDRQARIHLPALRVMIDLEFEARNAAALLDGLPGNILERAESERNIAASFQSIAAATDVVVRDHAADIDLPEPIAAYVSRDPSMLPLSATTYAFIEILQTLSSVESRAPASDGWLVVVTQPEFNRLAYLEINDIRHRHTIRPSIAGVWYAWHRGGPISIGDLRLTVAPFARAIERQAIRAQMEMLRNHPDFGDRYVSMREAVSRSSRVP
jgi:hypothetical protein